MNENIEIQAYGVLIYRKHADTLEVLLSHPGGPFWASRSTEAWSIIKGCQEEAETPLDTLKREFREETGQTLEDTGLDYFDYYIVRNNKRVDVYLLEKDFDEKTFKSDLIEIEYPQNSHRFIRIPENDDYRWFTIDEAIDQRCFRSQKELFEKFKLKMQKE